MREIRTSGLMSGEGKRSVAAWPKPPRPSSTLLKAQKNDAADAAAICEAMSRPEMRFVPVKSEEQQATPMLHKTRELLIKQRTMGINALRGHLSEFGIVAAKGIGRVDELLEKAESDATLPKIAKVSVVRGFGTGGGLK
jgi:transposase